MPEPSESLADLIKKVALMPITLADRQQQIEAEIRRERTESLGDSPGTYAPARFHADGAFSYAVGLVAMSRGQSVMPENRRPTLGSLFGEDCWSWPGADTRQFLRLALGLSFHCAILKSLPATDDEWQDVHWPKQHGVTFFGLAGFSAMHVLVKFSRLIYKTVFASQIITGIEHHNYDSVQCCPKMDLRIGRWKEHAIQSLVQNKAFPPKSDYPAWRLRQNRDSLLLTVADECQQANAPEPDTTPRMSRFAKIAVIADFYHHKPNTTSFDVEEATGIDASDVRRLWGPIKQAVREAPRSKPRGHKNDGQVEATDPSASCDLCQAPLSSSFQCAVCRDTIVGECMTCHFTNKHPEQAVP